MHNTSTIRDHKEKIFRKFEKNLIVMGLVLTTQIKKIKGERERLVLMGLPNIVVMMLSHVRP